MKLFSGWVWLLLSVAISLVVLSWAYFYEYSYRTTYAASVDQYTSSLEAEANKLPRTKEKLKKARMEVEQKGSEWQSIVEVKTPPSTLAEGGINMAVTPYQLTVDARKFRNSVQRAVASQLRKGGVTVVLGPQVPFPSEDPTTIVSDFFNYPAARFPVCIFELGQVTIRGSFEQISAHMRSWSNMPGYLAVVDGLTLEGTSPVLTARYNLNVVAFIRGEKMPPAAAGGGGGGALAGGGFPGGGFPGGGPPSFGPMGPGGPGGGPPSSGPMGPGGGR
jgi:hypothetical protein